MNHYEVLYIINDTIEEAAKKALIERFANMVTENGGVVARVEEWGRKRLAYPIRFMNEGYYVLMTFSAQADKVAEFERNFRISSENVLRFMVTCIPEIGEAAPVEADEATEAVEAADETPAETAAEQTETAAE